MHRDTPAMQGFLERLPHTVRRSVRRTSLGERLARSPLRPQNWKASWNAARTLWFAYGHLKSVRAGCSIDAAGDPLPWYTYPAIEYLKQFDFQHASIFEYGSGNSTMFWASRAARVISVEHNEQWYDTVRNRVPSNCTLLFRPDLRRYIESIQHFSELFDVIVVDGPARGRTRFRCAELALAHLRPGGLVILDNSDWLPESARLLRDSGLLQVDMSGFHPIGGGTQTTSLFFERTCALTPLHGRQPQLSAGGSERPDNWEAYVPPSPSDQIVEWEPEFPIGWVTQRASLHKLAPDGPRDFQVALRQPPSAPASVYLYDEHARRIVLGALPLTRGLTFERMLAQLNAMSWPELCDYVRKSPVCWCWLDDSRTPT
jgi:hypothetical protein